MKARIEMTAHGVGRIWLDGVEQKNVIGLRFESKPGGVNELTLTQCVTEVQIVSDETKVVEAPTSC